MGTGLRPVESIDLRPDGTSRVDRVDQANNRQLQTRESLPDGQTRLKFKLTASTIQSAFAFVVDPIPPEGSQSFYVAETGTTTPLQPPAGVNVVVTSITASARSPCRLDTHANGNLVASAYLNAGASRREQVAGLAELAELSGDLDGTNTIDFKIVNLSDQTDLEVSVNINAIQALPEDL